MIKLIVVGVIIGAVLALALSSYVEITDPCVAWETRGTNVFDTGAGYMIRDNRVCVARRSGWHE